MKKKILLDTLGIEIAVRDSYIGVTVAAKHENDVIYAVSDIIEAPKFIALSGSFEETISEFVRPTVRQLQVRLKAELLMRKEFDIENAETGDSFFAGVE